jgi:tetratricopeptide (TPR) repeat protein
MLVRLLLIAILAVISLFCWLSLANPVDIEFHFFGETIETSVSALMISSFVLGVILVFVSWLARDLRRAFEGFHRSRQRKKEQIIKEEFNRAMDCFIRGDLAKAKAHFVEVLKRDPSQIDLYLRLSEITAKEGKNEEALHWLERARWIDMKNVDILLREVTLYRQMKRIEDAIRTLNQIVDIDETNLKALASLREIYLERQRWEEVIKVQKSILRCTKGKGDEEKESLTYLGLKYGYARDLLRRGGQEDVDDALKEAKEIVRDGKKFLPGFVLLGDLYLRMGKWASAGKVWGRSFMRFKSIIFILRLEDLYLGREDPGTLLRIYQKALKSDPDSWILSFFYAKLCLRLEMLDEALEALDEISLRRKEFPALHRLLAEIYLHKKDFGRAAREFEKTFELSGSSYLPFHCTSCGRESQEWTAYCPQCHQWSSYVIKEGEETVPFPLPSISERVHIPL